MAVPSASPAISVIPALAGTIVLQLLDDGANRSLSASPVICWSVEGEGVVPVTARGRHDGIPDREYVILFPGGEVVAPDVGTWATQADYLEGMAANDAADQLPLNLALPVASS